MGSTLLAPGLIIGGQLARRKFLDDWGWCHAPCVLALPIFIHGTFDWVQMNPVGFLTPACRALHACGPAQSRTGRARPNTSPRAPLSMATCQIYMNGGLPVRAAAMSFNVFLLVTAYLYVRHVYVSLARWPLPIACQPTLRSFSPPRLHTLHEARRLTGRTAYACRPHVAGQR